MGETNIQGEDQKKLDVLANDLFINMLKSSFEVATTQYSFFLLVTWPSYTGWSDGLGGK